MNDYIFIFDAAIYCDDEECGQLAKVIFDPETLKVTKLVIEKGLLLKKRRIIPISDVELATEVGINISALGEELTDYSEYEETYVEAAPEGRDLSSAAVQGTPYGLATGVPPVPVVKNYYIEGIADHLAPMGKGTPVEATDVTVGQVYGVVINSEDHKITELLVHQGTIFVEEFLISTAVVERMSMEGVFLNITEEELDDLIEYDEAWDQYWERLPTSTVLESDST